MLQSIAKKNHENDPMQLGNETLFWRMKRLKQRGAFDARLYATYSYLVAA